MLIFFTINDHDDFSIPFPQQYASYTGQELYYDYSEHHIKHFS